MAPPCSHGAASYSLQGLYVLVLIRADTHMTARGALQLLGPDSQPAVVIEFCAGARYRRVTGEHCAHPMTHAGPGAYGRR